MSGCRFGSCLLIAVFGTPGEAWAISKIEDS
jgi:hypothetical protein